VRLERWPLWAVCVLIFAAALSVRIVLVGMLGTYATPSRTEINRIAIALTNSHEFANPYRVATGLTAHAAPVYPYFLSLLYSAFGTGAGGELAYELFNAALAALQFALLPVVAATFELDRRTGLLAGFFGALVPVHLLNETRGGETSLAAVLCVSLCLVLFRSWQREDFSPRTALLHGLCWGFALLAVPAFLTILASLLLVTWRRVAQTRAVVVYAAIVLAVAAAVLAPWTLRNYRQLGGFMFVRDDAGLEFAVSNNERSRAAIDDNEKSGAYTMGHPYTSQAEALNVRQLGEVAYNRQKLQAGLDWVRSHPFDFARLTVLRIVYFWFPKTTRGAQAVLLWLIAAAAVVGMWRLFTLNRLAAVMLATIWISFPIPFYVLQASVRYRYPIHWTFLVLAALAVTGRTERARQPGPAQFRPALVR
jgi:hypothetical protein